ncbi:MAG: hypothetical protein J6R91_06250 [Bacteroidaceae bacterium]|nr:hypothetical protein [Bacteroidaceae bacterium]
MSSKLREALEDAWNLLQNIDFDKDSNLDDMAASVIQKICEALAEPIRNCDIGTAEEQVKRFRAYCKPFIVSNRMCRNCPLYKGTTNIVECLCKWSQMPYEEVK